MKLYYIANIRLPTEKAHGAQIMHMCESFADQGLEVELVVPSRRNHIKEDSFEFYGIRNNFKINRLWCLDLIRFGRLGFFIQSLTFANSAAWYCLTKKGLFYTRDEISAVILAAFGKRVAWEVHMGQTNIFAKLLLSLKIPIITITNGLKNAYKAMGVSSSSILVAHDAFDPKRFDNVPARDDARNQLGLPLDKLIVAYIGKYKTMGESKGVADLIGPFKQLLDIRQDAFLLIVGPESDEVDEIEEEFRVKNVPSHSYSIVTRVPHGNTSIYMRAADILTLPYPNTPHYAHNMSPLKLFAYMGSGTAILAADLPSLREVLKDDSAFFYDPDDPQGLHKALVAVAESPQERERKASLALLASGEYTWEKRSRLILDFIKHEK
jgi:glycosyltransferase involved in cell wall biosynthesis